MSNLITIGCVTINVIWLAIGLVFLSFAIIYLCLAIKSRQRVSFNDITIDKLNAEMFTPPPTTGVQSIVSDQDTIVRSESLKLIAKQLNKTTEEFEQHLNRNIFPKVQKHLDAIYRTSRRGFWIAGILAIISAVLAFLSAFMVL